MKTDTDTDTDIDVDVDIDISEIIVGYNKGWKKEIWVNKRTSALFKFHN